MDRERREWERRGRFVEEQYVEDEDEWEAGRRSAKMLGCVLLGSLAFWIVVGLLVWLYLWPKT